MLVIESRLLFKIKSLLFSEVDNHMKSLFAEQIKGKSNENEEKLQDTNRDDQSLNKDQSKIEKWYYF